MCSHGSSGASVLLLTKDAQATSFCILNTFMLFDPQLWAMAHRNPQLLSFGRTTHCICQQVFAHENAAPLLRELQLAGGSLRSHQMAMFKYVQTMRHSESMAWKVPNYQHLKCGVKAQGFSDCSMLDGFDGKIWQGMA